MTNPVPSDLLARILDLVEEETGQVLGEPATEKLTRLLPDLAGQKRPGELGERFSPREVAVLLTDLRGFTSISETFPATTVLEVLNIYLTRMTEVVAEHGGTVDKFMGDSVMALFGAPTSQGNDAECAVICAVDMQIAMVELNEHHLRLGLPDLFMGIGVNTGLVMAGRLGSEIHSEYTVISDDVNTASRIEAFSLRGQILISESTYERCHDLVSVGEASEIFVKGKEAKIIVREVLGIPSLGKEIPRHEIRRSLRVRATMPFTYQLIVDKIVRPEVRGGTIVDISYHGVLAEVEERLEPPSEIKLKIDLSLVDATVADIYARICRTRAENGRFQISIEFTSVSVQSSLSIRKFVQLLIQGTGSV